MPKKPRLLFLLTALALGPLVGAGCGFGGDTANLNNPNNGPRTVSVSIAPKTNTIPVGGSVAFTSAVSGATDKSVTWEVLPGGVGGTIDAKGKYTAPADKTGPDTVRCASVADKNQTDTATVTVTVAVSVAPATANISVGHQQTFTASVTGGGAVTWEVLPGGVGGTIDANGKYTAPADKTGLDTIRATTQAAPPQTATATVTVQASSTTITIK